jgi:hypothetical protein
MKIDRSQSEDQTGAQESARFLNIAEDLDEEDCIEKEIIKEEIAWRLQTLKTTVRTGILGLVDGRRPSQSDNQAL